MPGLVSDIQRFSLHDGPGIRTTVFLKGCNLRCAWCHNPETLSPTPELQFDADKCIACRACVEACPQHAHHLQTAADGDRSSGRERLHPAGAAIAPCGGFDHDEPPIPGLPSVARGYAQAPSGLPDATTSRPRLAGANHTLQRALCVACGACARVCFAGGLELVGRAMTPEAVLAEVQLDAPFYARSGGGLTLSGGEPLLQADFAAALLRAAKAAGISTAIETNLAVPWANLAAVLPHTDLLMADLKVMDPALHRHWTGASNDLILANARRLSALSTPLIVRTPVIPGVNDTPAAIAAIAAFLRDFPNLQSYDLLPYHPLGAAKLRTLGQGLAPLDVAPPSTDQMAALAAVAREERATKRRSDEATKG